ncbi:MFS transporter [Streptomyces apricus]|uniref:MFS transporter n=1 Tax=Streptomyces apricus TaxID=1828112 RepID=A0A5B0BI51_9ACTN|nr:MFS transporter [Streptomyces apricus]KAA0941171.1 MFS transporter [Streptomyces apricus]
MRHDEDTATGSGRAGVLASFRGMRFGVVGLAFLAVLLDGFDSASLSFVLPSLAEQWGIASADFTPAVVLTNIGVVLGYLASGRLAVRLGLRRMLIAGTVLFGVGSLATALVLPLQSLTALSTVRLVTGLGLGVVLPGAVSLATAHHPDRQRQSVSVTVTLGLAFGGTVAGVFGSSMLASVGATGVFWIGGALPLLLAVVMGRWLPAAPVPVAVEGTVAADGTVAVSGADSSAGAAREARVGALFAPGLRAATVLLWIFAFLVFIASYTLQSWVPTLLTGYGFSASQAPIGLAFLSFGGVVGGIVLLLLSARRGIRFALMVMPVIGAVSMVAAATVGTDHTALLLALAGSGAGVTASQIGQLTLAVAMYPAATRTAGVGWAAALGRVGSIVGPATAGVLLALSLPGDDIVLLTAIPVVVAAASAAVLWRLPHAADRTDGAADTEREEREVTAR